MRLQPFPQSIRWQLPLSYAAIALLATLALGLVLLTTLRGYYAERERDQLFMNARAISDIIAEMQTLNYPAQAIESQLASLSLLSQTRVSLAKPDGSIIADSGDPQQNRFITFGFEAFAQPVTQPPDIISTLRMDQDQIFIQTLPLLTAPITPIPPGDVPAAPVMLFEENDRDLFSDTAAERLFQMRISNSPYGLGFNSSDISLSRPSDQSVQIPVWDDQQQLLGYLSLSNGPAYGANMLDSVVRALVIAGAIAVLFAAAVGYVVSNRITAPLLALTRLTGEMARGNLSTRVEIRREDEFGTLAHAFNQMAARLEEIINTLRRFIADAAHELHTPITALRADLEMALDAPGDQRVLIQRALEQTRRLQSLTDSLLDLSRVESGAMNGKTQVDLTGLLWEMSEQYASRAEQADIAFNLAVPNTPVCIHANGSQLRRAIANLLDNAIKFTPENGTIDVRLTETPTKAELIIQDSGIGISIEDLPHIFNRFYRGRNTANYPGSGLGLAIIQAIVEHHHGAIAVSSSPTGTQFQLQLPRHTP